MPLSWALWLPFLLLPIALVRRAPDIEGGFAFHVGVAVALALLGALGGVLAERRGERLVAGLRGAPFRYGSGVPLAVIGFVLSNVLARGLAAALELERLSPGGHLDAGVGLLVTALWVARAAGRGAHPLAGAVVALAGFVVATATQLADVVFVLPWRLAAWAAAAAFARVALRPVGEGEEPSPALRAMAAVVFALVAVPLGAIGARFAAPFVPGSIEGVTLARGGALAAGALGALLGARGGLHVDTLGALRLAVLGVAALPLVVYLAVFYALTPPLFLATGAGFALVAVLGAVVVRRPLAAVVVALWAWFYVGFGWITAFKVGPDAESCAEILAATDTRVLLERYADDGERLSAQPYDVLLDPVADSLLLTFKRIDVRGGFVDLVPRSPGAPAGRLVVRRPDRSGPLWPERFVRDPATGLYYFGMLGRDAFSLWEVEVDASATEEDAALRERRSWPLRYEPAYPAVDERRHLLVQPYLAGQVQGAPLLEVIDLDDPRPGERELGGISGAMAEYVAVDPSSGDYFVPMTHHGLGFDLLRVSGIDLTPVMRRPTYHPTIGLVADPEHGRLFATNPLAGTLVVYDLADLRPRFRVALGAFPRDIELDRDRERLYVGTYADGEIVVLDVADPDGPPRVRSRHPIGSLLRGISLDPASGLVHAASACGAFELAPAEGAS